MNDKILNYKHSKFNTPNLKLHFYIFIKSHRSFQITFKKWQKDGFRGRLST